MSLNTKQASNPRKVINLPFKTTLRANIVLRTLRLSLQTNASSKLERTNRKAKFFGYLSETTLSFILREFRWHGKLKRKRPQEVEVELNGKAGLYERRSHLYFRMIDQYVQNFADLRHCVLLRDKLVINVSNVVIRATESFNLQCNNVARQVEEKCSPFYRTFNLKSQSDLSPRSN